ncbi:hypothetical protein ACTFIZ_010942 [Dictyostelium cf. discoideum]
MSYYNDEILNSLNLSDFCYEKDDSTIIKKLNENFETHDIEGVIRGEIESSGQVFIIGYREKDINNNSEFRRRNTYYVSFRGTEFNFSDISTDLNSIKEFKEKQGTYHKGFLKRTIGFPIEKIIQWLENGDNVVFSGHSLGGSVSQILTITIILQISKDKLETILKNSQILCITFGSPLIGNIDLMETLEDNEILNNNIFHSIIHRNDPIPKLQGLNDFIKNNMFSIVKNTICWLFEFDKIKINEIINSFYQTLSDSSKTNLNSKINFMADLNSVIGLYHIVQHDLYIDNNSFIKSLSYKNDLNELNEFFKFSYENFSQILFHKLSTYRDILIYELITSKVFLKNSTEKPSCSSNNKVKLMVDLIPKIKSVSINKNNYKKNELITIVGENLCFISINTLKLIYSDGIKDILLKSIIHKSNNQIVIDVTHIKTTGILKSLQFKSNFKYNNTSSNNNNNENVPTNNSHQPSTFEIDSQQT